MKKFYLLVVACMLCIANYAQSGTTGNINWSISDGTLTITGSGAMGDYSFMPSPWNSYKSSITSVNIGAGITNIGANAFEFMSNLTSVTIPNTVTSIDEGAFYYCSNLNSVTIPSSTTSIGKQAFYYCEALASITIPNGVSTIKTSTFYGCNHLASITMPNTITTIETNAFKYCKGLTSLTLPNTLTTIGDNAFDNCSGLTSITIPASVTSIGSSAFSSCYYLEKVTCLNTTPPSLGSSVFSYVNVSSCFLNVPSSSVDLYKAAAQWKDFMVDAIAGVNNSQAIKLTVYPNPTSDVINIETPDGTIMNTQLYDLQGKLLYQKMSNTIDLSTFNNGVYILKVADQTLKVIKE